MTTGERQLNHRLRETSRLWNKTTRLRHTMETAPLFAFTTLEQSPIYTPFSTPQGASGSISAGDQDQERSRETDEGWDSLYLW